MLEKADIVLLGYKKRLEKPCKEYHKLTGRRYRYYRGCYILFKKNEKVIRFFDAWYQYWSRHCGRDMQHLAIVVGEILKLKIADLNSKQVIGRS